MASGLVRFCTAAFAGSLIGIAYERWPIAKLPSFDFASAPNLFPSVSADSSSLVPGPPRAPSGDDWEERTGKIAPVDPKVSAENFRQSSRFGLPSKDNLRLFNDFILSYDRRLRSASWVIEHLTPEKVHAKAGNRKKSDFQEDTTLHEYFRATKKDFRGSNYDRGHLAAAANHKISQDAMDQTFVMSNISPQESFLNQGNWERLESFVRWKAVRSKNLYVVSGPLYLPRRGSDGRSYVIYRVIGDNMVSVPTHYFKVFLAESIEGKLSMEAFMMPNDDSLDLDAPLDKYRVDIPQLDTIERASGVIFFDQVARNKIDMPSKIPDGYVPKIYEIDSSKHKNKGKNKLPLPA